MFIRFQMQLLKMLIILFHVKYEIQLQVIHLVFFLYIIKLNYLEKLIFIKHLRFLVLQMPMDHNSYVLLIPIQNEQMYIYK